MELLPRILRRRHLQLYAEGHMDTKILDVGGSKIRVTRSVGSGGKKGRNQAERPRPATIPRINPIGGLNATRNLRLEPVPGLPGGAADGSTNETDHPGIG